MKSFQTWNYRITKPKEALKNRETRTKILPIAGSARTERKKLKLLLNLTYNGTNLLRAKRNC